MLLYSTSLKSSQKNYCLKKFWSLCGRGIKLVKELADLQKKTCRNLQKCTKLLHLKINISNARTYQTWRNLQKYTKLLHFKMNISNAISATTFRLKILTYTGNLSGMLEVHKNEMLRSVKFFMYF